MQSLIRNHVPMFSVMQKKRLANLVNNQETVKGEYYRKLLKGKTKAVLDQSFAEKIGNLMKGVGGIVEGTKTKNH